MRDTRHLKATILLLFGALFLLSARRAYATPPDRLGKVNFPTTCAGDVQPTIEKGVALLHSFEYKESEQTFVEATTRDPKCAMARWGKAMARYHQLWDFPADSTLKEVESIKSSLPQAMQDQVTSLRTQLDAAKASAK